MLVRGRFEFLIQSYILEMLNKFAGCLIWCVYERDEQLKNLTISLNHNIKLYMILDIISRPFVLN